MITLLHGDCLEKMVDIPDRSIDMVLTDPPYGISACKWDSIIPLEPMWEHLRRIIKPNGAIVMTASQPFTTTLISSNKDMFKYCWVWDKGRKTNFFSVKFMPLKKHEDIVVFIQGGANNGRKLPIKYNPQGIIECKPIKRRDKPTSSTVQGFFKSEGYQTVTNYPSSILKIQAESKPMHPTQKPVALMEYLIKTYTNENDTVLDFAMGSGTTCIASRNLNRRFVGIELGDKYFEIARTRIYDDYQPRIL